MSDNIIEDVKKEMYEWAKQKIMTNTNISEEEVEEIRQQIWLKMIPECSKPITPEELKGLFTQKIKDWCSNHQNR